jgi:hypothetical protein
MSIAPVKIFFADGEGNPVATVSLYAEITAVDAIILIREESPELCAEFGEARVQLLESATYEYEVNSTGYRIDPIPGVVRPSNVPDCKDRGRITPGLNTGRLHLRLISDIDSKICATAEVEVRSAKVGYRDDYRNMLEYITERCTDLLLEFRSPVELKLVPDDTENAETLCQRFAFIRAMLTSRDFRDALNRLTLIPHRLWDMQEFAVSMNRGFKPTPAIARQIAGATRRASVPVTHSLSARLSSTPEHLHVPCHVETVDTPENRFVKHALLTFQALVAQVRERLLDCGRPSDMRFIEEAEALQEDLGEYLNRDLFRSVGEPQILPLGSPVLQRKGGYREILKKWFQFDMAARLCWSGGEEIYGAGKRDIATLYEYWLFFRLLEVIADIFRLDQPASKSLIEQTSDGFGLKLKSGRHLALSGSYTEGAGRKLRVKFSYNRTFSRKGNDTQKNFPFAGSWTERMRPDYTLTIWPTGFTEEEAEQQEVIVHVHFDAKYRVKDITEMFGASDESFGDNRALEDDVTLEKIGQREGNYRRADLLKMHAYKDAIRRTAGAYVLYPGTQSRSWRGFHEIVPGLGAFGIRPTAENDDGANELRAFIYEIVQHMCDRASRREQETYHRYIINDLGSSCPIAVSESAGAEYDINGRRVRPPQETPVLVAWYVDNKQLRWTEEQGLVVLRIAEKRGAVSLIPENVSAHYILLHTKGNKAAPGLFALCTDEKGNAQAPVVVSAETIKTKYNYPLVTNSDYYLIFHARKSMDYNHLCWDIGKLLKLKGKAAIESPVPFSATLDEILNCAVRPLNEDYEQENILSGDTQSGRRSAGDLGI